MCPSPHFTSLAPPPQNHHPPAVPPPGPTRSPRAGRTGSTDCRRSGPRSEATSDRSESGVGGRTEALRPWSTFVVRKRSGVDLFPRHVGMKDDHEDEVMFHKTEEVGLCERDGAFTMYRTSLCSTPQAESGSSLGESFVLRADMGTGGMSPTVDRSSHLSVPTSDSGISLKRRAPVAPTAPPGRSAPTTGQYTAGDESARPTRSPPREGGSEDWPALRPPRSERNRVDLPDTWNR